MRIWAGFRAFFAGLGLIRKHSLWGYIVLPALISLAVGVSVGLGVYFLAGKPLLAAADGAVRWGYGLFGRAAAYSGMPDWARTTILLLVGSVALLVQFIAYRTLASMIVIPFLGPLLNQVERIQIGRPIEVSLGRDLRNAFLGIWISIRFAMLAMIVLVLSLFLGPFQFLVNAVVQSYLLGRSAFDYIFEKEVEDLSSRKPLVKAFRLEILGVGAAFFLLLFIPIVGVIIGPAAAVAGAALIFHQGARGQGSGRAKSMKV